MNAIRFFLVLFVISSAACAQLPKVAIKLSPETLKINPGAGVWLTVTLINNSDHDIDCSVHQSNGVDLNYKYEVLDSSGHKVPRKARKHPELEGGGSIQVCSLKPNQTRSNDTLVSRLFDFSKPGDYTVQVSRLVSDGAKSFVRSNEVKVTVIP